MRDFNTDYLGTPSWDIGRPQPVLETLLDEGAIIGEVLDVGCGTGEQALYLAERGHTVWGVDSAPNAIAKAQRKADDRLLPAVFRVADALDLASLGRTFDTVLDFGLFHVFSDGERLRYAASLGAVVRPGGRYIMLCFSERQPGTLGPRRVSQAEIRAAFTNGWQIERITEARFVTLRVPQGAAAWLAQIRRVGGG